jgi:hypothetical protein
MNEPSTSVAERSQSTQPSFTQPVLTQHGRKGIAYDWQSLCADDDFVSRQDLSPAIAYS